MKLYRVTFQTGLLVEAEDERDAERIGRKFLIDEVKNGTSELWSTELLESEDDLRDDERYSLPWGEGNKMKDEDVNEILRRINQ